MYQLTHPVDAGSNMPRGVLDKPNPYDMTAKYVFIPMDKDNADFQNFLTAWKAGAEVRDPSGNILAYSDNVVTSMGFTPPA